MGRYNVFTKEGELFCECDEGKCKICKDILGNEGGCRWIESDKDYQDICDNLHLEFIEDSYEDDF